MSPEVIHANSAKDRLFLSDATRPNRRVRPFQGGGPAEPLVHVIHACGSVSVQMDGTRVQGTAPLFFYIHIHIHRGIVFTHGIYYLRPSFFLSLLVETQIWGRLAGAFPPPK